MQLPDVNKSTMSNYLKLFDQKLGTTPEDHYNGIFPKYISHSHKDEETFVHGRVSAEMYKRCVYKVGLKFDE